MTMEQVRAAARKWIASVMEYAISPRKVTARETLLQTTAVYPTRLGVHRVFANCGAGR